jgi:hypothetical protein
MSGTGSSTAGVAWIQAQKVTIPRDKSQQSCPITGAFPAHLKCVPSWSPLMFSTLAILNLHDVSQVPYQMLNLELASEACHSTPQRILFPVPLPPSVPIFNFFIFLSMEWVALF